MCPHPEEVKEVMTMFREHIQQSSHPSSNSGSFLASLYEDDQP